MKKNADVSLIQGGRLHSKTGFCHIRCDGFGIGKISFDFGITEGEPPKLRLSDKFWLDCHEAAALGYKLMSGRLQEQAEEAKTAGDRYRVLWQKQGGLDDKAAARQKKPVPAGSCWARVMSIVPASAKDALLALKYEAGQGHATSQGLIVPDWWTRGSGIRPAFSVTIPLVNDAGDRVAALGASLFMEAQAYRIVGHMKGEFTSPPYSKSPEPDLTGTDDYAGGEEELQSGQIPVRQADIPENEEIFEDELIVRSTMRSYGNKGYSIFDTEDLDGNKGFVLVPKDSVSLLRKRGDEMSRSMKEGVPVRMTLKNCRTSKGVIRIYVG